jgi:hypothetical protein
VTLLILRAESVRDHLQDRHDALVPLACSRLVQRRPLHERFYGERHVGFAGQLRDLRRVLLGLLLKLVDAPLQYAVRGLQGV